MAGDPSPERLEMLYQGVLKRVLWDDDREEIRQRLEVNGLTPEQGEELLKRATRERVATIRSHERKKLILGVFLTLAGAVYCWVMFVLPGGVVTGTRKTLAIPAILFGYGLWKLVNGLTGFLAAPRATGSVADME